jgi:uncharacterized protein
MGVWTSSDRFVRGTSKGRKSGIRWLGLGLATAIMVASGPGLPGHTGAARAQDLNDLLLGGAAIILELNRQQQIEDQRRRAQEPQRREQPTASAPRPDRATVAQIQAQLTELGYDPGPVDGAMGPRTRNAIIAFQRDKGLPQTGAANEATAAAVQTAVALASRAPAPSADSGAGGEAVVSGPSFDCARAGTPPERAICADPGLAALDLELARLYGDARAAVGDAGAEALRANQREWMRRRDACGADAFCINAQMEERIARLAAMAASGATGGPDGTPPVATGGEVALDTTGSGTVGSALDPAALSGLVLAEGLPVIALPNSGVVVRGLSRDYNAVQMDFLRRVAHGDTIAAGTFDALPVSPLRELSGEALGDAIVEALGTMPPRTAAAFSRLARETDPARRSGVLTAIMMEPELDEFDRRRVESVLAERARESAAGKAVTGPVDVLLLCAFVGDYDFDAEAFEIRTRDYDTNCLDARLSQSDIGADARLKVDAGRMPDALGVPFDEADALRNLVGNDGMFLAFPARISARLEPGPRPGVVFEGRRTGPHRVVLGRDPTQVALMLDETALPMTEDERLEAALNDFSRPWTLGSPEEQRRILDAAERVAFDDLTRIRAGASSEPLAFTLRVNAPTRDDADSLGTYMRAGGQQVFGGSGAQALAAVLGRPTATVGRVSVGSVSRTNDPLSHVVILLPRPAEDYGLPGDLPGLPDDRGSERRVLDLTVSETFVTSIPPDIGLPIAGETLVVLASPARLAGIDVRTAAETWQAAFPVESGVPETLAEAKPLRLALPSDLVHAGAVAAGLPPADVIGRVFNALYLGGDTFARQDAAAALAAEAAARAEPGARLVMTTEVRLRAFDLSRGGWDWTWLGLRFPMALDPAEEALYINPTAPLDPTGERLGLLPMPADEARALSNSAGHPVYLARVHITMDPAVIQPGGSVTLPYRVHEIELLEQSANLALDNPDARVTRIVLGAPPAARETPAETTDASGTPDSVLRILGLGIGDTTEAAAEALRERMPSGRVYTRSREAQAAMGQVPPEMTDWSPYLEATLYVSEDERDMVALYRELPHMGEVVSAITRSRFFDAGEGPVLSDVARQLVDTFGEPAEAQDDGGLFVWNAGASPYVEQDGVRMTDPEQSACLRSLNAAAAVHATFLGLEERTRANNWTPPEWTVWLDEGGERWLPPIENPIDLARLMDSEFSTCRGEHLFAWVQGGSDGRLTKLRLALVNPTFIAQLAEQNREAMQSEGGDPSGGGSQLDL